MKIKKKIQGITLIGFLIVLFFLGFFVYAGMQLGPVYMDHYSVIKAMKTVSEEGGTQTPTAIKTRLAKL
ncbi:MAG: DUF4845 domain-containing protein, partial [Proteobacteria bacterium]|nr:DUF4845 domain-containing protein [Pseudomonadota bacterium]